jgi:hypothetical protein
MRIILPQQDQFGVDYPPVMIPMLDSAGSNTIAYDGQILVPANTTYVLPMLADIEIAHGGGAATPVGLLLSNYSI